LLLNALNTVFSFFVSGHLRAASLSTSSGAGWLFLWGTFLTGGLVYIAINVLAAKANGHIGSGAGYAFVALIFLYGIFWSLHLEPRLQALYLSEVPAQRDARQGAWRSRALCRASQAFINTYSTPVTLQNIGWKTYTHLFGLPFPAVARHVGDGRRDQGQVA
jgi:hypothetical protein